MNVSRDSSDLDWSLVARYFAGEMSSAERADFERWIGRDPSRRDELVLLRQLWEEAAAVPTPAAIDGMWRALAQRIATGDSSDAPRRPSTPTALDRVASRRSPILPTATAASPWRPALMAAAATVFITIAISDWRQDRAPVAPIEPPVKQFRTAPGQRATIQLTDGSRVELGIASVLTVEPFTDSVRNVTLEGEAMFDVVHDERRPFRVRSAGAITEDLGTRFGIRAYPEDRSVRVFVTSGLVRVRGVAGDASKLLRPGDLARVSARGAVTTETNVDTTRYLAWTNSRVVLRNERLSDAAVELGRWHDVPITIRDPRVARMRITVDMPLGSLDETLKAVTIPLGLRYEISDRGGVILR